MNIYKKLYNVQQSLKAPKDLHNSFANYNYRTTEAILEAAKPLLKENNLIILLDDEVETKGEYNYIRATAKIVDIETGEHIETSALAREDRDRKNSMHHKLVEVAPVMLENMRYQGYWL